METNIEELRKAIVELNTHVVKGFKIIDSNFEAIDVRFGNMDKKLSNMDSRLGNIESNLSHLSDSSAKEFGNVGGQLSELKEEVIKIQKISGYSDQFENLLRITK